MPNFCEFCGNDLPWHATWCTSPRENKTCILCGGKRGRHAPGCENRVIQLPKYLGLPYTEIRLGDMTKEDLATALLNMKIYFDNLGGDS